MQEKQADIKPAEIKPAAQAQRQQRPALPGVIFDSDMGANIDAALALALLYGASTKVKVIGVTVTNPSIEAAAYCDVLGRFYASGGKLNSAPPHYYAPIGYAGPVKAAAPAMLAKPLALTSPDGKSLYGNEVTDVTDTADVALVFRNALLTQKDGEGVVVAAGPATNLVRAMAFPGNRELIAAKVGVLILAAGSFGQNNEADPRVKADMPSLRKVLADWLGQIIFIGREAGAAVPYPAASVNADFAWAPNHPVAEAYKANRAMPYDAAAQAVIAALYATAMKEDLFSLSPTGTVEVAADGQTKFIPSASGKHRYILPPADPASKERIVKAFTALASAKPVTPPGRGGFRQQQNQVAPVAVPPAQP